MANGGTALARRDEGATLSDLRIAEAAATSKCFGAIREPSQALMKILYGRELGFGPVSSMLSIHFFEGSPRLSAAAMASLIRKSPTYDYVVSEITDEAVEVRIVRRKGGEEVGCSRFSVEDARRAGLAARPNFRTYPRNMLFARALSNAFRWYCPDLAQGVPIYGPGELPGDDGSVGAGDLVVAEAVVVERPKVPAAPPTPLVEPRSEPASTGPSAPNAVVNVAAVVPGPTDEPARVAPSATARSTTADGPLAALSGASDWSDAPLPATAAVPAPAPSSEDAAAEVALAAVAAAVGVEPGSHPLAPDPLASGDLEALPEQLRAAVAALAAGAPVPTEVARDAHALAQQALGRAGRPATAAQVNAQWKAVGVSPTRGSTVTARQLSQFFRNVATTAAANGAPGTR